MENESELLQRIQSGNFIHNNGRVIRTINLLKDKYAKLSEVQYGCGTISHGELRESLDFLSEEGYIRLRTVSEHLPSALSDADFENLEAKVTGKGFRLLWGNIKDQMVK